MTQIAAARRQPSLAGWNRPLKSALLLMPLFLMGFSTAAAAASADQSCTRPVDRPFRVFNGMFYTAQPDLARYGLDPIHLIDRDIWPNDKDRSGPPSAAMVRRYIDRLPKDGAPVVLDIEDFDPGIGTDRDADHAIARLLEIHQVFKSVAPERDYGYYSMIPFTDYWRAIKGPKDSGYRAWQRRNDRLAKLEGAIDSIYPSVYTNYPDRAGWVTYARANICEARRLSSKPVYAFLWPEYHPSADKRGEFLSAEYWRLELETAYAYADGIVIWGGFNTVEWHSRVWDPQAAWWKETQRFLDRLNRGKLPPRAPVRR